MGREKQIIQEAPTTVIINHEATSNSIEEDDTYRDLSRRLAEIRKHDGVEGYILRSPTSATVDLREPEKIVEYATFSSQALDSGRNISHIFDLGNVKNVIIEGKVLKVLCIVVGENKIDIFMEKDVDHDEILAEISP